MTQSDPSPARTPRAWGRALAALDGAIVLCAGLLAVYLIAGRIHLGILSVNRLSKPLLVLLVLGALRAAIPRGSWLSQGCVACARE